MSRHIHATEEAAQDSFLDVVANLVGVIIILVMLVGTKSAHTLIRGNGLATPQPPAPPQVADAQALRTQVTQARLTAKRDGEKLEKMVQQLAEISSETKAFEQRRVKLAMHRQIVEEDMARRERELSDKQQEEFETQRKIVDAKIRLDELTKERLSLLSTPAEVEEIECVPTPLAREVDDESIHLRVRRGRVSIVPLNELMNEMQIHLDEIRLRLHQRGEVAETFGPLDDYRLKLTVKRVEVGPSTGPQLGQSRRVSFDPLFEFLPIKPELGQDVTTAFTPGSDLYRFLENRRRNTPTVVVWLYTDSFNDSHIIKRTLWEMGYTIAMRPMEPQRNISASPYGSKAAAQ